MSAVYGAIGPQTIQPGESAVFTEIIVPCNRGFVRFRQGTPLFTLSGWLPNLIRRCCRCRQYNRSATYDVHFDGNLSIPTGGTPGTISVALSIDGVTSPETIASVTPAAVEEPFHIGADSSVQVWNGCCQNVSLRNISDQPIVIANATIKFSRPDLDVTY